jgi:hypothetical protein
MQYYIIIALQVYCFYHLYKNRNSYYWVFLILFVPLIGSAIYLITQVYNKRDVEKIQDNLVSIINPSKKIKDLEKQLQFSESYQNRLNLADAYLEIEDYNNAIQNYLEVLDDTSQNDFYVVTKLVETYYKNEDFENVVFYAEKIKNQTEFKKSRTQFVYGLAQEKLGNFEEAETNLKQIDVRYSFYNERLMFAEFLLSRDKKKEAKEILEDISTESQHMTKPNKRLFRATIQEVEKLLLNL